MLGMSRQLVGDSLDSLDSIEQRALLQRAYATIELNDQAELAACARQPSDSA